MNPIERALAQALEEGTITQGQFDRIRELAGSDARPWLQIAAYTLGGALLLGAVLWLFDDIWRMLRGLGLVAPLFGFSLALFWAGAKFWDRRETAVATIFVLAAAALMPAGVHHLWRWLSLAALPMGPVTPPEAGVFFSWWLIDRRSLAMALSTVVYCWILYRRVPSGLLALPGCIGFWYLLWILAPAFLGRPTLKETAGILALGGAVMMAWGFALKPRDDELIADPGSVMVSVGALFFWGAATMLFPSFHPLGGSNLPYLVLNVVYLVGAVKLRRLFPAMLGSIGVVYLFYFYLGRYYDGRRLLPWVLLLCGSLVLSFGVWWGRRGKDRGSQ